MARRTCEDCGMTMQAYQPRLRVGQRLLCQGCANTPGGGLVSSQTSTARTSAINDFTPRLADSIQTVAHDSGDGMTIYHCCFCGSGQVIARSDRTIECQFCHTSFTVQVQPEFSAFPQTVDGMPMQVPGMPGQTGVDPMGGDPAQGGDPNAAGGAPPFGGPPGGDGEDDDEEDGKDPEEGDDNQVFASRRSFATATGALLSEDDFIRHLAIQHADNKGLAVKAVKASRAK